MQCDARSFKIDVLECPRCQARLKIIATVTTPSAVKSILECLGLPARPPPLAAAREREQGELGFDAGGVWDGAVLHRVVREGRALLIEPEVRAKSRLDLTKLKKRRGVFKGSFDDLVQSSWESEWRP